MSEEIERDERKRNRGNLVKGFEMKNKTGKHKCPKSYPPKRYRNTHEEKINPV